MIQLNFDRYKELGDDAVCVELPGSKSMAARALVMNYVEGLPSPELKYPLCEDTERLAAAIGRLRDRIPDVRSYIQEYELVEESKREKIIFEEPFELGEGGTTIRFFTALIASIPGVEAVVNCSTNFLQRPMMPLIDALAQVGADIKWKGAAGYPPYHIVGKRLEGVLCDIKGNVSSQFASALLMALDLWKRGTRIYYSHLTSKSYLDMTFKMLESKEDRGIETDWSAAAFFYELLMVSKLDRIKFLNLTPPWESMQGDSRCVEIFHKLGIDTIFYPDGSAEIVKNRDKLMKLIESKRIIEFNLEDNPDLAPALAVGMAVVGLRFRLLGLDNLRYKESNRLVALKKELAKIGIEADEYLSKLEWKGVVVPAGESIVIDGCNDHRIVMAFAPVAAKTGYLSIKGENCVAKSYPGYFEQLGKLGFSIKKLGED